MTTMEHELPNLITIKSLQTERYAYYYKTQQSELMGYVCCEELNVFSPLAKIEVETAKVNREYVHLRFCCNNKYWSRGSDEWIVAISDQPEEDISKESCTLFKPIVSDGKLLSLVHVQSGKPVGTNTMHLSGVAPLSCVYIYEYNQEGLIGISPNGFTFMDWNELVIMPKYVRFKGYNDKYLRSSWIQGHAYLEFSSDDGNEDRTAYEIAMNPDGSLLIKSIYFGKYWRRSPNWIWGDSTKESAGKDIDTLFKPVKLDGNTIALRNAGNNNFCKALTTEGKTRCLNAAVSFIATEARLQVEELVLQRDIYDIEYRIKDARIYDEKPIVVGTGEATNETQKESTFSVTISYEDKSSYSFNNSLSLTLGVETTIKTEIPIIVEGGINITTEITKSFEWGRATESTTKAEATYGTVVPPMSTVKINYIATQGKCNVPFSYTQRDKLSYDGTIVLTRNIDGEFLGANYYDFRFEQVPKVNNN